ncbi:hypothetical protein S7335_2158 [Synechococcus sp. PCC 7335]|nr:hypothetical protein S7335_2158 [Synechococcus sp. PCC 7335]
MHLRPMSIEQTNQLILLILNSALMMLLSAGLLCGAWLRQDMLLQQIRQAKSRYQRLTRSSGELDTTSNLIEADRLKSDSFRADIKTNIKRLRNHRQQLKYQYEWSRVGMLVLHAALIVFGISLLCLSLRSLFDIDRLIIISLVLFTLGSAGLIAGSGCTLMTLSKGDRKHNASGRLLGQLMVQGVFLYQKLYRKRKTKATPHAESG